jgi:hypothetical protein
MFRGARLLVSVGFLLGCVTQLVGQSAIPQPLPRPKKPPSIPKGAAEYDSVLAPSDAEWGLERKFLEPLYSKAAVYEDYMRRFTCNETARVAEYDGSGHVKNEKIREYGYLLVQDEINHSLKEFRREFARDGTTLRGSEIDDKEPFPAAYAWVFLFSRFNEPYFSYRFIDDRFDGFDWIYEVQFRGSLPFKTGKDIREWEGTVLIDAVTHSPLKITAEPAGQRERIEALYREWSSSFNIMGMRTGSKPLGYRATVELRHRDREVELTLPTSMRYETFSAVSLGETVPVRSSARNYSQYRIFGATADPAEEFVAPSAQ